MHYSLPAIACLVVGIGLFFPPFALSIRRLDRVIYGGRNAKPLKGNKEMYSSMRKFGIVLIITGLILLYIMNLDQTPFQLPPAGPLITPAPLNSK